MDPISENVKYIAGRDGIVQEVILPITLFKKMVDELEDKKFLEMMKEIDSNSPEYLSENESFELINSLIENCEIQTK